VSKDENEWRTRMLAAKAKLAERLDAAGIVVVWGGYDYEYSYRVVGRKPLPAPAPQQTTEQTK